MRSNFLVPAIPGDSLTFLRGELYWYLACLKELCHYQGIFKQESREYLPAEPFVGLGTVLWEATSKGSAWSRRKLIK